MVGGSQNSLQRLVGDDTRSVAMGLLRKTLPHVLRRYDAIRSKRNVLSQLLWWQ